MNRRLALMSAGSMSLAAAIAAHMHNDKAKVAIEAGEAEAGEPAPTTNALDGLPDSHPDWRVNAAALAPIAAQSPLETRQQRRGAQKALARGLATAGKLKERENRVMQRKRERANAAARRYDRIKGHVPAVPK